MGKLTEEISFTGSIGNISAYRMKGCDKIILRKKGGGSRKMIKTSRSCAGIREMNAEFGGRSVATRLIRQAMFPVISLADFNFTGLLNGLLQPIQVEDPVNGKGKRNIELSKYAKLLEGFSLNRNHTFEAVIRNAVSYSLDKESRSASVTIPALMPGINFFPLPYHPMYSIVLTLGIVPDLFYEANPRHESTKHYTADEKYFMYHPDTVESAWQHITTNAEEQTLTVTSKNIPPDNKHTLILSIGVRYGTLGRDQTIEQVAGTGSAKILASI